MSILDRFKRQPEWKHRDPAVRAEAVRRLAPAEHHDLLVGFAQADADPQVRRAAVRKLQDPDVLIGLAHDDEDEHVREAALETLLDIAVGTSASAERAAAALEHPKHLSALAREGALAPVRADAVRRLTGDRALAALARAAEDPEVRRVAVERTTEDGALLDIALKSEHKDAAMAALERLSAREAIEAVAARARSKAAAKRARAIAEERFAPEAPAPSPAVAAPAPEEADAAEAARYDDLLARQAAEAAARAERGAERVTLCETVEALAADEEEARLEEASAAWAALPSIEGPEADGLQSRFDAAAEGWRARRRGHDEARARSERMEAACAELEAIAELPDAAEAERRHAEARRAWTGLESMDGIASELQERYARAVARLDARKAETREEQARREAAQRSRLEALCDQVERLSTEAAPSLKVAERALREARAALDEPAHGMGKRDREALMGRLKAGRAALYTKVQEVRQTEDWKRWANVGVQEELCREAEALVAEPDLPKAARLLRDLDARWKQAGQAPKAQSEPLWQRFRAARSQVRSRSAAHFAQVRAARAENVKRKEALIAEAEGLAESTDWARTAERMRAMQEEWKAVGPVSREKSDALWARFRAATGRFFTRQKEDRVRRRADRAKSLERKEALIAQAEALADSKDWDRAVAEIKRLQSEWRSAGTVPKDKLEPVTQRFRQACDRFFERYKNRESLEAAERIAEREALCAEVEALAGSDEGDLPERVRQAQAKWRSSPALSGPRAGGLQARFTAAVDSVVAAKPDAFRNTDLDPAANRARLEALCASVEAMAPASAQVSAEISPAMLLAERWREALAANTMGARVDETAARRERKEKVEAARAAWARVGPVGAPDREQLSARFREACRRALGEGS